MQQRLREGSPIQSLMMLKMLMVGSFCFGVGNEVLFSLGAASGGGCLSQPGTRPAASSRGVRVDCCSGAASTSAAADREDVGWVRGEDAALLRSAAAEAVCSSTDCRGVSTGRLRWLADLHALGRVRSATFRYQETAASVERRLEACSSVFLLFIQAPKVPASCVQAQ